MSNKNEDREVAVQLSGVKKMYKLGQIGGGTLQGDIQSWWARVRHKEDPNTKIGTDQRLIGQTFMALNGIDLTIYKGEALGIIGGNGAGKSTLLKLLSRVTAPTSGEIDIYGRIASMLEVGTGFNGEMTGRENVYMNGAILGMTKAEIDAKMEDIIEFSEVREFIDTPVKRYSSGMYVKLAFSVAAHLDSEIMIMDEVLAVGDMAFQKKCLDKMRDAAKKQGRTVLYVSHNMNTIRQLCDRCVVLNQGKVVFEGGVEESIQKYLGISSEAQMQYDYNNSFHSDGRSKDSFRILSFNFLSTDTAVFEQNQPINFNMKFKATQEYKTVFLRFEVQTLSGQPVTTVISDRGFDIGVDQNLDLQIKIHTKHLMNGKYRVNVVAFLLDEFGAEYFLDGVYPGFVFEINDTNEDSNNALVWLGQYWGNVRLDDAKILSLNTEKDNG